MTPGSNFTNWLGVSYNVTGTGADAPSELCLLQQTSATAYDSDGNVTATIDARGNVTATAYDDSDNDVADYTGQALAFNGASVTFESLAPNYQNWYDVYAQGGGLNGFTSSGTDPNAPHLGRNWVYEGEMAVTQGETSLTVNSGAASAVCLLQLATSTAYDDDGNVTATIDAMGRVTASYFDASDNDAAGYQGQVLGVNDRRAALSNVTPDSQPVYNVYGYSATAALTGTGYTVLCSPYEGFTFTSGQNNWSYAPYGIYNSAGTWYCAGDNTYAWFDGSEWQISAAIGTPGTVHSTDGATGSSWAGGTVSTGLGSINSAGEITLGSPAGDPTAPSLGDGWCLLGTVTVFANTTSLQVSYSTTGTAPPDEVCLLQQTTATTYDDDGNALTVTDALGRVTTDSYNDLDQLASTKDPDACTTGYTYDSDGNVLTETDPDGNTTTYTYNDAGQVTSETQQIQCALNASAITATTTDQYDADGNLVETADCAGQRQRRRRRRQRDRLRLQCLESADGRVLVFDDRRRQQ